MLAGRCQGNEVCVRSMGGKSWDAFLGGKECSDRVKTGGTTHLES